MSPKPRRAPSHAPKRPLPSGTLPQVEQWAQQAPVGTEICGPSIRTVRHLSRQVGLAICIAIRCLGFSRPVSISVNELQALEAILGHEVTLGTRTESVI